MERSVRCSNIPTVDIATYSFDESPGRGGIIGSGDIGMLLKVSVEPDMSLSEGGIWISLLV